MMRSVPSVMRHGYGDELFQAWRDGKIRQKDLPEVVAMTLDLCERWRAEQERCRRVHAAQRLSRDHSPSRGAAAVAAEGRAGFVISQGNSESISLSLSLHISCETKFHFSERV